MRKEDIITLPNSHLRQKSKKIKIIDDTVLDLVTDMKDAAVDWENSRPHEISAALAAIQIDKKERVVIIRSDFENKESQDFTVLINPEIVKREGKVEEDFEGCLSIKNIYGKVPRHTKVRVRALDIDGSPIKIKAEGFLARVLQHEIDHTNGIVFIDHIKDDKNAFYKLDENGEIQPVNYETHVAGHGLFDD